MIRHARPTALALCALLLGAGCALKYKDADGVTHVWGLAHVEIREVEHERYAAIAHQVTVVGLSVLWGTAPSGFALGYSRAFGFEVQSADGAGDLRLPEGNPVHFEFDDMHTILEENP